MKTSLLFAYAAALLVAIRADAAEFSRSVSVVAMAAVAPARVGNPANQAFIRVYFPPAPWGSSSCRGDAADISPADWHLYSLALQAWRTNRTVTVVVDDSLRPDVTDTVCQGTVINTL